MKRFLITVFLINVVGMLRADIVEGKAYRIVSAADDKRALFVENSSTSDNAAVVLWTNTDVPAQQWKAVDNGDGTISFENVFTGKYLARDNASITETTKTIQGPISNQRSKWTLQPTSDGSNRYLITQSAGGKRYLLTADSGKDGDAPKLQETEDGNVTDKQTWVIDEVVAYTAFGDEIRTKMIDAWLKQHLRDRGSSQKSFGNGGGWGDAEMLETMLDAYETSGKQEYLDVFKQVFSFFSACVGTAWDHLRYDDTYKWYGHDFNDDVMWMIIASARAYHLTGMRSYLNNAKNNFDKIYARALNQWGMLRWAEQSGGKNGTNSCINGPAEVAACYIAMGLGTEEYYEIARSLYENQRRYLFNAQTGQVYDAFTWDAASNQPSGYNRWASTYNQGTMLGAAILLYNHYKDEKYRKDAEAIVEYTKKNLCNEEGIIKVCQTVDGDLCGFKGILMRYLRKYIIDLRHPEDVQWMQDNAMVAFNNRNSHGITSSAWLQKSCEDWKSLTEKDDSGKFKSFAEQPFGNSTAVSVAFNAPLDASNVIKDAYSFIPASSFNYINGVCLTEGTGGADKEVSGFRNRYYAAYSNVDFGTKSAKSIEIKISQASTSRIKIEVRDGDSKGPLLGTADVPQTGGWQTLTVDITPIDGMHDIYLVCNASASAKNCFSLAGFNFSSDLQPLSCDITDNGGHVVAEPKVGNIASLTDNKASSAVTINGSSAQFVYFSPISATLKGYAVASHDADEMSDPKAWTLYGSDDDGETWHAIDSRRDMKFASRCELSKFDIVSDKAYNCFRLDVTENNGAVDLAIGEWQLYGTALSDSDITADGGTLAGDRMVTDKNASTYASTEAGEIADFTYNSNGRYTPTYYSITAASAEHAPQGWTLFGENNGEWVVIDRQVNQLFPYDGCTQFYKIASKGIYKNFRLTIDVTDGRIEIAELQLFGQLMGSSHFYSDITDNLGTISTSDNATDADTRCLIDNDAATTCRLAFDGSAWIQYHTEIPTRLSAYLVGSGYSADKNPADWMLEGSVDGKAWTKISSTGNAVFDEKGSTKLTAIRIGKVFNYFRLTVTKASSDNTKEIEIGELQLYGVSLSDNDIIAANKLSTAAEMPGMNNNETHEKLFDSSVDTKYCFNYYGSAWIDFEADKPVVADMYSITSANDASDRNPKSWELQASDDGNTWITLDKRTGESFYGFKTSQFYSFSNDKAYKYYRLQIVENGGAELAQLSEWQLFYTGKVPTSVDNVATTVGEEISYDRIGKTICVSLTESAAISIYNGSGQLVAHHILAPGRNVISVDKFVKGLYIVNVTGSGIPLSTKFIR